jgi:hypothetical protein
VTGRTEPGLAPVKMPGRAAATGQFFGSASDQLRVGHLHNNLMKTIMCRGSSQQLIQPGILCASKRRASRSASARWMIGARAGPLVGVVIAPVMGCVEGETEQDRAPPRRAFQPLALRHIEQTADYARVERKPGCTSRIGWNESDQ